MSLKELLELTRNFWNLPEDSGTNQAIFWLKLGPECFETFQKVLEGSRNCQQLLSITNAHFG